MEAGFRPFRGVGLVDEARGCVSGEELGEVEAVRLHGDGRGGEG